jgi:hypothetical protein
MIIFVFLSIWLSNLFLPISLHRKQTLTPLKQSELFEVLKESHVSVFGKEPSINRLASGWAQIGLENGQGNKIYNNNLGNIGGSKKQPHFFIAGHRFKSNDSPLEGAIVYWNTIKKMCSAVLAYFDAGDPNGAAKQLYRCGYYRADPNFYSHVMSQLFFKSLKELNKND